MTKKRILAFTSIRSDYDLLSPLYRKINAAPNLELKLLVSGAHLSKTYGYSVSQIKNDGLTILCSIESLIDSDSKKARIKTAANLLQSCIDVIDGYKPDVILFSGDREDAIIAALVGIYLSIPTIHFYGGDHASDGNVDNAIRHACSKLASLHFVSHESHKQRLIKLGESPERIFLIGSIAIDKLAGFKPQSTERIRRHFGIHKGFRKFCLLVFHPVIQETEVAHLYLRHIMEVLDAEKISTFVGFPNTDAGNKPIIEVIESYRNNENFFIYTNLDRKWFLSLFARASFMIGNSSAGIMEAASIPIPAINVGTRQVGRFADKNVVFCGNSKQSVAKAITLVESKPFRRALKNLRNSYGDGRSSSHAMKLIENLDLRSYLNKREDPLHV